MATIGLVIAAFGIIYAASVQNGDPTASFASVVGWVIIVGFWNIAQSITTLVIAKRR